MRNKLSLMLIFSLIIGLITPVSVGGIAEASFVPANTYKSDGFSTSRTYGWGIGSFDYPVGQDYSNSYWSHETGTSFKGAISGHYEEGIMLIPHDANKIVMFKPDINSNFHFPTLDNWPAGFTKGPEAFYGGVAVQDNYNTDYWLIPYNADRVIRVQPDLNQMDGYDSWPAGFSKGDAAFRGAVYDGTYIWMIPFNADRVIRLDPGSGEMVGYNDWPAGFTKGLGAFSGGVFDGTNVWLIPHNASHLIKLNRTNGTMTAYNNWPAGFTEGNAAFNGAAFDGQRIWMAPSNADRMVVFNTKTNVMNGFKFGLGVLKPGAFNGAIFDGRNIYFVPGETGLHIFDTHSGGFRFMQPYQPGAHVLNYGAITYYDQYIWMTPTYSNDSVIRIKDDCYEYYQCGASYPPTNWTFDETAPSAPVLSLGTVTSNSVALSWTQATDDSASPIQYAVYQGSTLVRITPYTTTTINSLTPNTQYDFTVHAVDAMNNSAASNTVNPKTLPAGDTTAPSISAVSFQCNSTGTNWVGLNYLQAFDNVGVTAYEFYHNNTLVLSVPGENTPGQTGQAQLKYAHITGLTPSTSYTFQLKARDLAGNYSTTLTLNPPCVTKAPDTTAPTAPVLSASDITKTSAKLDWTAATDNVGVTGYRVYRDGTLVTQTNSLTRTFTNTGLTSGTQYIYTVKAIDAAGNESLASNAVTVTTLADDTVAPSTPTKLAASNITKSSIQLSWSASTDNVGVTGYRLFRGTTLIATVTSGTTYQDTGLTPDTVYSYTVRAIDAAGNVSAASNMVSPRTLKDLPTPPADLKVSDVTSTTAKLSWSASTGGAAAVSGYKVFANGKLIATVPAGTTTYDFTGLTPGTEYAFSVVAVDANKNEVKSNVVYEATPTPPTTDTIAPSVPSGMKLTAGKLPTELKVTWGKSTDTGGSGMNSYKIYVNGATTPIVVPADLTTYTITGLDPNTTYSIQILAEDNAGNQSALNTAVTLKTAVDKKAPIVPVITTHDTITTSSFTVYWTPSVDDVEVEGYEVFVNGVLKGTSSTLSLYITGLDANKTYSITVRAYDATGNKSAMSKVYTASTYAEPDTEAPSIPLNATAFNITATSFDVTWNASTDNKKVVGYEVFKDGVKVGTTTENVFSFTGLDPLTTYDITVKAIDASGNLSAESSVLEVTTLGDTTKPTAPTDLAASNVSGTKLTLNWSPAKDDVAVDHYEVYKDGVKIEDNVTDTSITVEELDLDTSYDFSVTAVDAAGNTSDESLDLEITTTDEEAEGPVLDFTELNDSAYANLRTKVKFTAEEPGFLTLNIRDASGKIVQKGPQNTRVGAGGRNLDLNTRTLKDGTYTIEVTIDEEDGGKTKLFRTLVIDHIAPTVTSAIASNISEAPTSSAATGKLSNIQYTLSEEAFVTVEIYNSAKKLVATVVSKTLQTKGVNSVQWNGYDRFNKLAPDGKYSVLIKAVDRVNLANKPPKVQLTIERAAPTISHLTLTPSSFVRNSTTKIDINYRLDEASKVTIDILQSDGTTLVRNLAKDLARTAGTALKATWNGTNSANVNVAAGTYIYRIQATDASGKLSTATGNITVSSE